MRIDRHHYETGRYFEADKWGGIEYELPNGTKKTWGYFARQSWQGWDFIIPVMKRIFHPKLIVEAGSGCGSFILYAQRHGLEAFGFDFSAWACNNPVSGLGKELLCADARFVPLKDKCCDFLFSTDLLEHIYEEDLDTCIDDLVRLSTRWAFFNMGTVPDDQGDKSYILKKGQDVPLEYQANAVAGHVTFQTRSYWLKKLNRDGWELREEPLERFRRLLKESGAIAQWTNIIVLERT